MAPEALTSRVLAAGAIVGAACFAVALGGRLVDPTLPGAGAGGLPGLVDGLAGLRDWAWASLGTGVVIATPALGLVATALEYASVSDRRTVLLALAVLAVLLVSVVVALGAPS